MTDRGMTAKEIAHAWGVSIGTINRDRSAMGIKRAKPPWHDKAIQLRADGMTCKEIAERVSRAPHTVMNMLAARGAGA